MSKKEFIEGVDYYLEKGLIIFTDKYLLERPNGCCGNKCRHCPFTKPPVKGNKELEKPEKI